MSPRYNSESGRLCSHVRQLRVEAKGVNALLGLYGLQHIYMLKSVIRAETQRTGDIMPG